MSSAGRGRGYLGRHRQDEQRPGDVPLPLSPTAGTVPIQAAVPVPDSVTVNGRAADMPPKPLEQMTRGLSSQPHLELTSDPDDEKSLAELLHIEDKYRPVVTMLEQIQIGEDGIAFNRKLKEIETTLSSLCQEESQLLAAFSSLRGAALNNAATARKLATVGASFTRQQRHNVLRNTLLNIMQSTFSKLDVLERSNPQILTNAATLMGDYFTEARLANGGKVQLLCAPLLQYMRSLLASGDKRAHRALATQLMQNGRDLLATSSQELDDLSIAIRRKILNSPATSAIWLLLSADLCINKFLPLPASLQTFYASNLDLLPDDNENKSYSEVQYGSWKNQDEPPAALPEKEAELPREVTVAGEDGSVRKLRPILGAGARLNTSISEPSPGPAFPAPPAPPDEPYTKSMLAKRYDLNSWRQSESDSQTDSLDESFTHIPTQQFTNENFKKFSPPQQFPQERKYSQDLNKPFQDISLSRSAQVERQTDSQHHDRTNFNPNDRPNQNVDRTLYERPNSEIVANKNCQNIQNSQNYHPNAQNFSAAPQNHVPPQNFTPPSRNVTSPSQTASPAPQNASFPPPNVAPPILQAEKSAPPTEKNFQTSERHRRPPENWRKDKPKEERRNWGRQKSKEVEESEQNQEDNSRVHGNRRRDGRSRRKTEEDGGENNVGVAKTPPRRHAMEVPRGRFWDHDDRLDKDYNS